MGDGWTKTLKSDPRPWLLEKTDPAVRHATLRTLLHESGSEATRARAAAMRADPIDAILRAQEPEGCWIKTGAGYAPKYRGTVWQVIFLDQLCADGADSRVRKACEYVLSHSQSDSGGFGASGRLGDRPPPPSAAIHCLNGNLLRALIGFGWLDDERVRRSVEWQARSITGEGFDRFHKSGTAGPGFRCVANGGLPCAWGAIKALGALARVPKAAKHVRRAVSEGADFLLSGDPGEADYPTATNVNSSWFKLGFPSGYVADVLQNLEVLAELGRAKDPRLAGAVEWLLSKQDEQGRWRNEYAYNGKTWVNFERQGTPSKWVTLRACRFLSSALR